MERELADIARELYGAGALVILLSNNVTAKQATYEDRLENEPLQSIFSSLNIALERIADEVDEWALRVADMEKELASYRQEAKA